MKPSQLEAIRKVRESTGCGIMDAVDTLRRSDWYTDVAALFLTEGAGAHAERLLAERRRRTLAATAEGREGGAGSDER